MQIKRLFRKIIPKSIIAKLSTFKNLLDRKTSGKEDPFELLYHNLQTIMKKTFSEDLSLKKEIEYLFDFQREVEGLISQKCEQYYQGNHPKHHLWKSHYKFIIENVLPGDNVLDVGSGASLSYIQELAGFCTQIDCCDIRKDLIERCIKENNFNNITFKVLDITEELPKEEYDVVILSHILEHLKGPEKVLQSIKQITNKIIVRLPRYDDHWTYLVKKDLGLFYYKDHDHKREYVLDDARELITSAGWKLARILNDVDIKIVAIQ